MTCDFTFHHPADEVVPFGHVRLSIFAAATLAWLHTSMEQQNKKDRQSAQAEAESFVVGLLVLEE